MKLNNKKWLLSIILFSILIRIPYFNCPLFMDEGEYAYQAYLWLNEGINFYKSHFFNMLPGFPLIYAFIFKTFGPKAPSLRFFLAIWNAATVFFIYLIAKRLTNESIALISSFFYACFSALPLIRGNIGKEIFMLLPLTISLYFYILYLYNDNLKRYALFLSGFFSGLAIVFKQSCLPPCAFFLIFICLKSPNKIKDIFIYLLGLILPIFSCFIYGSFSLGIKDFFYYTIFCRLNNASIFCGPWWYHFLRFLRSIIKSGIIYLIILLILGIRFIKKEFVFYFLIFYLFFNFLGISLGGSWYDHYYAQLLPPLCILLGWEIFYLLQSKKMINILVIFILLILPFFQYVLLSLHFGGFCCKSFYPECNLTPKIVSYLEKNCNNATEIYAFLYSDPSIYFLSKKKSALPYLFKSALLFYPEHIKEFTKLIKSSKRPDYLITYSEAESIIIANRVCELKGNIFDKIQTVLYGDFRPFCKDYPIQISLIKQVFKTIPKYYMQVDNISFRDTITNIWKKKTEEKN